MSPSNLLIQSTLVFSLLIGISDEKGAKPTSAHDFSKPNASDPFARCSACHVPADAETAPPLKWAPSLDPERLDPGQTRGERLDEPSPVTRVCLGCHDGTVAADQFHSLHSAGTEAGSHPVGKDFVRPHAIRMHRQGGRLGDASCQRCHDTAAQQQRALPFFEGRIECATCHDPHGLSSSANGERALLRLPMRNSVLCLYCHDK